MLIKLQQLNRSFTTRATQTGWETANSIHTICSVMINPKFVVAVCKESIYSNSGMSYKDIELGESEITYCELITINGVFEIVGSSSEIEAALYN